MTQNQYKETYIFNLDVDWQFKKKYDCCPTNAISQFYNELKETYSHLAGFWVKRWCKVDNTYIFCIEDELYCAVDKATAGRINKL